MHWVSGILEGLFYRLISPILLCKTRAPQKHKALSTSHLSDEEVDQLVGVSPKIDRGTYIHELTEHLCATSEELLSAEFVRTYTAIPVPMHERFFRGSLGFYLVQQCIPGRILLDVWPYLGWWMRLRVALTLRFYIHELRCISSRVGVPPFPGPPSDDGKPRECIGRLFTSPGAGPFNSYREISRWYQNRLLVMKRFWKDTPDSAPFDDSAPLVFTHQDLHPRNIILGDDGQLWIIDWSDAGWYPSWFESASMTTFANDHKDIPSSWTEWIPFIAGSCDEPGQLPFIRAIAYSLEVLMPNIMNLASE